MTNRSKMPEYAAWRQARYRCAAKPGTRHHRYYGARGISMCAEWDDEEGFEAFFAHIGPRPSPQHMLDRIDNERGYEPGNVRWATRSVSNKNRRSRFIMRKFPVKPVKTPYEPAILSGMAVIAAALTALIAKEASNGKAA